MRARDDGTGPANGHPRRGGRGTRTDSKLGQRISVKRLERLLGRTPRQWC